jgi:hypothetical protein
VWWVGGKPVDLYVGSRRVLVPDDTGQARVIETGSFDESLQVLERDLRMPSQRGRVQVWLSGGLCRPFVVPAVPGAKALAERLKIAQALATVDTGLIEPQVWLEDRASRDGCVASCVERLVLQRITTVIKVKVRQARILRIAPWWAEVLRFVRRERRATRALVVHDCDAATVLASTQGEFAVATALSPIVDVQAADDAAARLLLPLDIDPADVARVRLDTVPQGSGRLALGAFAMVRP